jgi:filamentous hemagglutinin family protein
MRRKNTNEQLHTQPQFSLKPVYAAVLLAVVVQTAQANPIGGTVAAGQASFATTGNTLTVTNTPGTIINWQGFSIGANEITHFAQQSASSAVLNRVISNNPSSILGTLQSNGRVFLINTHGIVFGAGAVVDVAGLVASTLNLSNADFLAGRNHYTQVPGAANVSNAGNITAHGDGQNGGQIFLIAPNVENTGVITAPNGEILLAAGYSVDLVSTSDPDLRVNITAPAGDATNVGQLIASSGSLGLFGTVVRNSGTVSADSATMQGGKIVFKASQSAEISGTVSATGVQGGDIQILGKQVALINSANVDASGINGGGTVLVGGDAHGANAAVQNAQQTFVDATATIKADALQNGNGGKVVVWADGATQFNGNISARGGAVSGNGGWVEVSGKQWLGYAGLVNTTAANGMVGSLLLDPTDITIGVGLDSTSLTYTAGVFSDPTTTPSILNVTTLQNQLASSNVTVDTTSVLTGTGNITIADSLLYSSPNTLTLNAAGTGFILVNTNTSFLAAATPLQISVSGGGSLVMQTAGGSIGIGAAGGVTITGGGSFTANAGGATSDVIFNSAINTGTGAINLTAGQNITELAGGSLTTTGLLTTNSVIGTTLNGANTVGSFNGTNATSGDIALTNSGDFNLGTVTNSAASGGIIIGGDSSITQTGNLTTSGGAISVTANINLTMNGTTAQSFGAYGGQISYTATNGNVQLGLLDAGTGYVYVVAGGNITDGNGASVNNIKAFNASLLASNADGGPGSIDVDTQVQNLTVDNSMVYSTAGQPNNPVTVRNTGSVLAVYVYSGVATGQLTITNDNTINVEHIGGATNTTLTATGGSSDITVICNCGTLLSAGNIVLKAGQDIWVYDYVDAGGTVTATAGRDILVSRPYSYYAGYIQAANGIDLTMQTGGLYIDGIPSYPAYLLATSGNINVVTSTGFKNGSISGYGDAGALSAPLGRWLIWAPDPSTVVYGGLVYDFKQYNTAFGGSVLGTGNGFIYTIAPTVTFGLTGTVSKVYDGTNTASLIAGNFLAPVGAIDGDIVNVPVFAVGSYDTSNVGTGKTVTSSGATAATNGGAAVYGYHYSASGAVGTITPASFTILVPTVINEIVNTSLLFSPDTGSSQSTSLEDQKHKPKPENVVIALDTSNSNGTNLQSLPVCH